MMTKADYLRNERAVSPVVGVMLMLVVTIIIAAVVAAFAGGLVTSQKAAPTLAMDVKIINTGTYLGSGFYATVNGVSTPIPTSDIKLVTSWTTTNRTNGQPISGGNTSLPNVQNVYYHFSGSHTATKYGVAPFGVGPGVGANGSYSVGSTDSNPTNPFTYYAQHFGNYTLMQGTSLFAFPAGASAMSSIGSVGVTSNADGGYGITGSSYYTYTPSTSGSSWQPGDTDMMQAVLGFGWQNLKPGDPVNVKVIHVPSGKVIYQKTVYVTEG
jgi:FlaG/FlaF family flagellin (archaellin)